MRKRILIAECKQEVSTFNPNLSRIEDFGIRRGSTLLDYHRTVRNEVGGALSVFDADPSIEVVPTYSAFFITSGGTLAQEAWLRISSDWIDAVHQAYSAGSVDGIYFCMHGAMCSEQEFDPDAKDRWGQTSHRCVVGPAWHRNSKDVPAVRCHCRLSHLSPRRFL
jgi:microcystin degradation protein MlrC